MKVNKLQPNPYKTIKNTGYIAATSLGIATLSGLSKNKNIRKIHQPAAIITVLFTCLHIGLIKFLSNKKHKM